jgi:hypothetical protein
VAPTARLLTLSLALAAFGCVSSCSDRKLTPWFAIRTQRPVLEIVHVARGPAGDQIRVLVDGRWVEALSVGPPALEYLVLQDRKSVVVGEPRSDWKGWRAYREGSAEAVDLRPNATAPRVLRATRCARRCCVRCRRLRSVGTPSSRWGATERYCARCERRSRPKRTGDPRRSGSSQTIPRWSLVRLARRADANACWLHCA